ncbi:MAG: hypothetical protein MMC23_008413 [Stictis urceolatum]|nr:hypothetical protein [Stictis urceolata]
MTGVTDLFSNYLQSYRQRELRKSKSFRKVETAQQAAGNLSLVMSPVTTFVVFTLLSRSTSESWLDPAKAFTSLSLISLLSNPIVYFTFALPRFTGSIACYDRIQSYLLGRGPVDPTIRISPMQEKAISSQPANGEQALLLQCNGSRESVDYLDDDVELKTLDARELPMSLRVDVTTSTWNDSGHKRETLDTGDIARLRDASFAYDPNSKPILNNLTLNIKVGEQIMVAGPVGCGKSTLLQSLVGEVYQRAGISLKQSSLQIGLCTQVPWFSNGTLREIIVGHSQFDKSWYSTVIDACALETDFAQMPLGDQTLVGAQGATLSGGQKKRIALARALYAKGQLLLLDDVLSGVDQRTEAQVVEALFGNKGICQRTGIAVILATSSPKYMMHFDTVVLLDQNGYISQQGPSVSMLNITSSLATSTDEVATSTPPESEQSVLATFAIPKIETEKSAVDPSRQHGDFSLYATYFRAMGLPLACLIMLSSLLFVICFKTPDILLQQWSLSESSTPGLHTILYISIYTLLAILALLSIILFNWLLMVTGMPIASSHLHTLVLHTTLNAPYHLLSSTPTGDLLNRFSQDMSLIDTSLPFALSKAIDGLFTLTAEALLITLSSHWTLLLLPPLLLTLYFLQSFYLRTSRQLRLLEIEAKAPLYGHFLSTLSGLPTIRAFGWTAHYSAQARAHLDYSQRPLYLLYCIQRWLGLVLDLIVAGFAVGVLAVVTQLPSSSSSSALGVSMANILTFSGTLTYVLQAWAELETSIGAVARVKAFVEGTGDEREDRENVLPPERWPDRGEARVKGVSARYGRGGEAVLKGVELEVGKGEKVGVVGRTGSGKSSLLLALLRLVELDDDGGGEIWIDGVDITRVPRGLLRERMAVVPQETPIWVGSVRMNLAVVGDDARGDDHVLLDALKRVGLLGHVMERGGLDTELNAAEWSAGQRQLLGIARVVVKAQLLDQQGGLLLLDEPTACLDEHAEEVVMDIVNEEFSGWTVIAIAHRPRALKSFDRVVVMDAGRIVREHGAKNVVGGWDL